MLIKIRNSLAISGIRCRIFKNQPPQTHKSPLVGWSKLIFNTFTSPQGGAKLLLLGEKLSSHFTVHSHFTAPKPRCSSWGYPISTLPGHFPRKNLPHLGMVPRKDGRTMPNRWRSHQHVASVVRMMPRSKNSEKSHIEPKPTSWKGDERMNRRPSAYERRRKPSIRSIDRS